MNRISLVIFGIFCLKVCSGQNSTNLKTLVQQLFATNEYYKNVRPNSDLTKPMEVDLDFFLCGINELSEKTQKLTTTGYLEISWVDQNLSWDSATYNGISYFYISQNDIWKPDLTLQNGFTKIKEFGESFINVKISNTGDVLWYPFEVFETKCTIDIKYFPFDQQTCDIVFVVWSSSIDDIKVTQGNDGVILNDLEEDGVWTVVSTSASEDVQSDESRVKFSLTLERNSSFYVINVIVPVVLLGILNIFTFVLPAECGEKISYPITVFLSFVVFLTIVSSELPKTSISILGYYLMFQVGMGAFVVCFTASELRLLNKKEPVPPKIVRLCIPVCRNTTIKDSDSVNSGKEMKSKEVTWEDVISRIDFALFWISLMVVIIVTVVMVGVMVSH